MKTFLALVLFATPRLASTEPIAPRANGARVSSHLTAGHRPVTMLDASTGLIVPVPTHAGRGHLATRWHRWSAALRLDSGTGLLRPSDERPGRGAPMRLDPVTGLLVPVAFTERSAP